MKEDDGRAIPTFIAQALNNEPVTVFGEGKQTRSFCYISDTLEGIYRLMRSPICEPVNLGNPEAMTILELANKIVKLAESKSKIVFRPLPQDDPRVRQPDITKAREVLGWSPKTPLEEGLKETIECFRGILGKKTGTY